MAEHGPTGTTPAFSSLVGNGRGSRGPGPRKLGLKNNLRSTSDKRSAWTWTNHSIQEIITNINTQKFPVIEKKFIFQTMDL